MQSQIKYRYVPEEVATDLNEVEEASHAQLDVLLDHVDQIVILFIDDTSINRRKTLLASRSVAAAKDILESRGISVVKTMSTEQV
jgi:hypothetical protein